MKRLIIALLLLASTAWAGEPIEYARMNPYVLGAGVSAADPCASYELLCEECESGQGSWTTGAGTPDYADTSSPLRGSKSFTFANGTSDETAYIGFTASGTVYGFARVKNSTNGASRVIQLGSDATAKSYLSINNANVMASHGTITTEWAAMSLDYTNIYYVWFKYVKSATGEGNGVMQVWVGTTTTRPASPFVNISTGDSESNVNRITIGLSSYGADMSVKADQIYLSATEFTTVSE